MLRRTEMPIGRHLSADAGDLASRGKGATQSRR
jgi:hypothetical protein